MISGTPGSRAWRTLAYPCTTTQRYLHPDHEKIINAGVPSSDGSVQGENGHVPGRHQLDEYVCAGTGVESWEPRFTYHGFRYVEVTGLPTRPRPEDLLGRVVHSRVPDTGTFRCSEPFFEQLDRAMRRTVLNNLHGIPIDTPMFEKNCWTGDAQLGAPVMTYAFGMQRFLTKWISDLADSQTPEGQLPVIVPSGGWGYREGAQTSIQTVRGRAAVGWNLAGSTMHLHVQVPVGSTAEVHVPAASGTSVVAMPGARFLRAETGFAVHEVACGWWRFTSVPR